MRYMRIAIFASVAAIATSWLATSQYSTAAEPKASGSRAASSEDAPPVSARPPEAPVRVVYKPPAVGRPARTVGGGTRGTNDRIPVVFAIAPDHVGRTTSVQPSLFWYIDRLPDPTARIEFTLLDASAVDPLVEKPLAVPERAGLQRIRLSDYGVQLSPDEEYEWSVALVIDPDDRSKDIVATGLIDRVTNVGISTRVDEGDRVRAAAVYAAEGIFYDAFSALSDQIDLDPTNAQLNDQRADLLRQVGLEVAAGAGG